MTSEDLLEFETPENIMVRYQSAGLGTRFMAWLADAVILWGAMLVIALVLIFGGSNSGRMIERMFSKMDRVNPMLPDHFSFYLFGIITLMFGLGGFLYYGLSELFMKGQTIGKRSLKIRVVSTRGFVLLPRSIIIRNLFRIIDNYPLFWIVPFFSRQSQRLGDIVAGTLVVKDEIRKIDSLRETLLKRSAAQCTFHFSPGSVNKVLPVDVKGIESLLKRWNQLRTAVRDPLLSAMCSSLVTRIGENPPPDNQQLSFITDFLTAYYRQKYHQLD